ncbi:MAG: DivIVA domain-containing protein [Bacillota bacterium]|nr:DivIVA domain-containing protein [Bacillota bacterium]
MISPFEIEEKEFANQAIGYKKIEVDEFLYKLSNDIENLLKIIELKDKEIVRLEDELLKFNRIEKNITEALIVAKETSHDIVENAQQKAKLIIHESEINSKKIIDRANNDIIDAERELKNVKKNMNLYRVKMDSLIQAQLQLNNSIGID